MVSSISNLSGPVSDAIHMQQALYGFPSSTTQFNTYVSQATIDDSGFASSIASNFVNTNNSSFALQVLKNLGITPETLPAGGTGIGGSYALLLQALGQFFESYALRERGQIVLNLTRLLTRLEDDATYGAIARSYNNKTTLFHQQSTNTVPDYGDSAPAAPTKTVTYSATTFAEAVANDGSISTTSTITLANDTFTGTDGQALTGAVVTNTPTGLTAVLTKTSATTATLSFTGQATNHANANDIQNLTVTLGNTAFTSGTASAVTGATKSNLVVDFMDPPPVKAVTYSTTTFAEAVANDGSISTTSTITLANDTFTGTDGQALTGAVVTNTPAGLIAVLTKTSATTATLSFTGQATNHANANDIQNLTVTLGNTAFTSGTASAVTGATKSNLVVDFMDPPAKTITYSATTFAEAVANDGSISTTSTITLANDTFTGTDGQALTGAVVTNTPAGLTAVLTKTSATTATLSFTGQATNHDNANDIQNLTVTLGDTAFTSGTASAVTGATKSNLVVDFMDPPDTTAPIASQFKVANWYSVSATSNEPGTLGLYDNATGALIGRSATFTAGALTQAISLYQMTLNSVVNATLKIFDSAGNVAADTQSVILGTPGSDTLTGTANVDFIFGFDGDNTFTGGLGNDVFIGGMGLDRYNIDAGDDQIINFTLGQSTEVVINSAGASVDASFPSSWNWRPTAATINSAANTAFIIRSTDNYVNLSGITSGNGYTVFNAGYQSVIGSIKDDILIGTGANSSTFDGGSGNDAITSGPGSDNITLGSGNDTLIFNSLNGTDNIADYSVANDSIQLSKTVFTALTGAIGSAVSASEFVSIANVAALTGGSVAASTNAEQLIYVVGGASGLGELYYNADGATAGGLTLIGKFTGGPGFGPSLVASEFTLIA